LPEVEEDPTLAALNTQSEASNALTGRGVTTCRSFFHTTLTIVAREVTFVN